MQKLPKTLPHETGGCVEGGQSPPGSGLASIHHQSCCLGSHLWQGAAACQSPRVCTHHMWGCVGCALPLLMHPAPPAAPRVLAQPGIPWLSVHPVSPASGHGQSHPWFHRAVKGCFSLTPTSEHPKSFLLPSPACPLRKSKQGSSLTPREQGGHLATTL